MTEKNEACRDGARQAPETVLADPGKNIRSNSKADTSNQAPRHQDSDVREVVATLPKNRREEIRVSLSRFRGVDLFDIRCFTDIDNQIGRYAIKKGLSARIDKITALIAALQAVERLAIERGLISEGGES